MYIFPENEKKKTTLQNEDVNVERSTRHKAHEFIFVTDMFPILNTQARFYFFGFFEKC